MNKYAKQLLKIRSKMEIGGATIEEIKKFLAYVEKLEEMVEEASQKDFYGTEGWQFRIGLTD